MAPRRGCHLFYRFLSLNEPFPKFLEPDHYFKRFVLCELGDPTEGVSYNASYALHKRLLERFHIHTNHVLHFGRGQLQARGHARP